MMDRREFAAMLSALCAVGGISAEGASAQETHLENPFVGPAGGKLSGPLPEILSGTYQPGPDYGSADRRAHRYLVGKLKAGDIQIEIHSTTQKAGAEHEAVGKHLHNELWLMREGTCELTTNGVTRRMTAGDVGVCVAGHLHYVRNAGDGPCTYFVVTIGPPEP